MRDDTRNYLIVGIFVILMVTTLVVWVVLMTGRTGPTDEYYVVFQNVKRLKSGVEILFEGYPVGHIESIRAVEVDGATRFRIDVGVRKGWQIPTDSEAGIAEGLFSAPVIEILGGEAKEMLDPGQQIPSNPSAGAFAALESAAGDISSAAASFRALVDERVVPMLDDNRGNIDQIFANVTEASGDLTQTVKQVNSVLEPENVDRIRRILASMESAVSGVEGMVADLDKTKGGIDRVIRKVDALMQEDEGDLAVAIADLRYSLATISRHVDAIGSNLESTTRNLNEASRQVRDNPNVLLTGRKTDDGL